MKIKTLVDGFYPAECQIPDKRLKVISENSLERVLNLAVIVAEESRHPDANTVISDIEELKAYAVMAWYSMQQAIFAAVNNIKS